MFSPQHIKQPPHSLKNISSFFSLPSFPSFPPEMSALTDTPLFDELFARMNDPSFSWGDEALLVAPSPAPLPTLSELGCLPLPDPDADWECPELSLRKDIWEHFPVTLIPLGKDVSGAERHSVQWHRVKLAQSRESSDFDEDIAMIQRRLLKALEASPKWDVLPAEQRGYVTIVPETPQTGEITAQREICILRMNFVPEAPTVPVADADDWQQVGAPAPAPGPALELRRLNDLRDIHCVWKAIDGTKTFSVQIHEKNTRAAGLDVAKHSANVLAAIKHAATQPRAPWRTLPKTQEKELCRIEIP